MKQNLRKRFWIILITALVGYLAYMYYLTIPDSWNYRITVTMQTPKGDVSGSTVRSVEFPAPRTTKGFPEASRGADSLGEAVIIDLGEKGKVFALIEDSSYWELTISIRNYRDAPVETKATLENLQFWPQMVWFEDIDDPKSVKFVHTTKEDPENNSEWIRVDHSAELFGEGYAVKDITIEITDEPVTYGAVEKILPWIWEYRNKLFDGREIHTIKSEYPLANSLGAGSFVIGER